MILSKYKNLKFFRNIIDLEHEIIFLEKKLFKLQCQKFLTNNIKTHLFYYFKRKIIHLKFKKASLLKKK